MRSFISVIVSKPRVDEDEEDDDRNLLLDGDFSIFELTLGGVGEGGGKLVNEIDLTVEPTTVAANLDGDPDVLFFLDGDSEGALLFVLLLTYMEEIVMELVFGVLLIDRLRFLLLLVQIHSGGTFEFCFIYCIKSNALFCGSPPIQYHRTLCLFSVSTIATLDF